MAFWRAASLLSAQSGHNPQPSDSNDYRKTVPLIPHLGVSGLWPLPPPNYAAEDFWSRGLVP